MNSPWIVYNNQNAGRNKPLGAELISALDFLPEMGVEFRVFSGGNDPNNPIGSTRHNGGRAADGFFYQNGRKLSWENKADIPILSEIVAKGRGKGLTGFGAGKGYMLPGSMHVGFGKPAVWGDNGSGANAPGWLKAAANGKPMSMVAYAKAMENGPPEVVAAKDTIQPQAGYNFASSDPSYQLPIRQQSGYSFAGSVDPPAPPVPAMPEVRSAADESIGNMRPTAFQQHSARQTLEGDPSQIPHLMRAFGLTEDGKQRLQPRGTSPGILGQMMGGMSNNSNGGIMSFLSKIFG